MHSVKVSRKGLKLVSNVHSLFFFFFNIATTRIMLKHISKVLKHNGNALNILKVVKRARNVLKHSNNMLKQANVHSQK